MQGKIILQGFNWKELNKLDAMYHYNKDMYKALEEVKKDINNFPISHETMEDYKRLEDFEIWLMQQISSKYAFKY